MGGGGAVGCRAPPAELLRALDEPLRFVLVPAPARLDVPARALERLEAVARAPARLDAPAADRFALERRAVERFDAPAREAERFDAVLPDRAADVRDEDRLALALRLRPLALVARWLRGTSATTTAPAMRGISFSRKPSILSSSRRIERASLTVSWSPTDWATAMIA